jgi:hypothetical protein
MERAYADEVIRCLPRMRRLGGSVRDGASAWVRDRRGPGSVELSSRRHADFCDLPGRSKSRGRRRQRQLQLHPVDAPVDFLSGECDVHPVPVRTVCSPVLLLNSAPGRSGRQRRRSRRGLARFGAGGTGQCDRAVRVGDDGDEHPRSLRWGERGHARAAGCCRGRRRTRTRSGSRSAGCAASWENPRSSKRRPIWGIGSRAPRADPAPVAGREGLAGNAATQWARADPPDPSGHRRLSRTTGATREGGERTVGSESCRAESW